MNKLKVIAFDADDTLWVNEPYFQEVENRFCEMMEDYHPQHTISRELLKVEIANLSLYGYGVKGYILSMIEAALHISGKTISIDAIEKILDLGKEMLEKPIELLDGVENILQQLQGKYRLVVATKGDLLDQERKLKKSGLEKYFHHIEIMSDKQEADYQKLLNHLDIQPEEFMMIGNSLKSDVLPVLKLGGIGVHVPYHTTWAHETVEHKVEHPNFYHFEHVNEVLSLLISQ